MACVKVRLFSPYSEAAGEEEIRLDSRDLRTLGDVLEELRLRYPGLQKYFTFYPDGAVRGYNFTCLVNGTAVGPDRRLKGGEEIMILPPMEGGLGPILMRPEVAQAAGSPSPVS